MIDVARLRHSDHRMQQQCSVNLFGSSDGHFFVNSMQRITRLKGDDVVITERQKTFADLCGRQSQVLKIVVAGQSKDVEFA